MGIILRLAARTAPPAALTASAPPLYQARSKRRWWAHAQGDNGILEAVIFPELFIREGPSGITSRSFLEWPIMAT